MPNKTTIEWTDATWNPVTGCTKVSPGCTNCYIVRTPPFRTAHRKFVYQGKELGVTTGVTLHPDRLDKPLHWRKPRRIFVNSLSDLFHEDVPDSFLVRVYAVMALAPQHTFQVLTKRPRNAPGPRNPGWLWGEVVKTEVDLIRRDNCDLDLPEYDGTWPLPNVWLGVSVENQHWADIRIPLLAETPAAVRFLSCEPLLGPVDLRQWLGIREECGYYCDPEVGHVDHFSGKHQVLDWVIVGGESGPGARPMDPDWARKIRDDCQTGGVPFFFKQWGEWLPTDQRDVHEGHYIPPTKGLDWVKVGKKEAGADLDGMLYREMP